MSFYRIYLLPGSLCFHPWALYRYVSLFEIFEELFCPHMKIPYLLSVLVCGYWLSVVTFLVSLFRGLGFVQCPNRVGQYKVYYLSKVSDPRDRVCLVSNTTFVSGDHR